MEDLYSQYGKGIEKNQNVETWRNLSKFLKRLQHTEKLRDFLIISRVYVCVELHMCQVSVLFPEINRENEFLKNIVIK